MKNSIIELNFYVTTNAFVSKNSKEEYAICKKGIAFYRELDMVMRDSNGLCFGETFPEEIHCKYVYYGMGCKKYKVEGKKRGRDVYFKIYEYKRKYDWMEISGLTKTELDDYFHGRVEKFKNSHDFLEISGFKTWAEYDEYFRT